MVLFILELPVYFLYVKFEIFFFKFTMEISRVLFILEPRVIFYMLNLIFSFINLQRKFQRYYLF